MILFAAHICFSSFLVPVFSYTLPGHCTPNTCLNGGRCVQKGIHYYCECYPQFYGTKCEKRVRKKICNRQDFCNGRGEAKFKSSPDSCTCNCDEANKYAGQRCQVELPCANVNCGLSGACVNVDEVDSQGYECHCASCFEGSHCQNQKKECSKDDPCSSNPCSVNATCISYQFAANGTWKHECPCKTKFKGHLCSKPDYRYYGCVPGESEVDYADAIRRNMTGTTRLQYTLASHWMGKGWFPEKRGILQKEYPILNYSYPTPANSYQRCYNGGTCIPKNDYGFVCNCTAGWTGLQCEYRDPCYVLKNVNKKNKMPEVDNPERWSIDFQPIFEPRCKPVDKQECIATLNPGNPTKSSAECRCRVHKDPNCYPPLNLSSNPLQMTCPDQSYCFNGGTCIRCSKRDLKCEKGQLRRCVCQIPFWGRRCQLGPGLCSTLNCQFGGYCQTNGTYDWCACPSGTNGFFCEEITDYCALVEPCMNGAVCTNSVNTNLSNFTCACQSGFSGKTCSIPPVIPDMSLFIVTLAFGIVGVLLCGSTFYELYKHDAEK